jgi:hypothetical protein
VRVQQIPFMAITPASLGSHFTSRKFREESSETFRDGLFDDVLALEQLPDCPQPRPSGQDVIAFGLARQRSLPFNEEGRLT